MHGWKKDWYSLIGQLMIWVAFVIFVPILAAGAILNLNILPALGESLFKTTGLICVMILAP